MSDLRIDRVEVRLRGGSVERARELAAALPMALARALADRGVVEAAGAAGPGADLRAPAVRVTRGAPTGEIATGVAGAVAASLRPGGGGQAGGGAAPRRGRS